MKIIDIREFHGNSTPDRDHLQGKHHSTSADHESDDECAGQSSARNAWVHTVGRVPSDKVGGESGAQWGILLAWPERRISDDMIYSRIIFSLFSDTLVDDTHIGVRVVNGLVTLSGAVRERCHKIRAENIAANENGVTMVRNLLAVSPEGSTNDRPC